MRAPIAPGFYWVRLPEGKPTVAEWLEDRERWPYWGWRLPGLDDDCWPEPDDLERLSERLEPPA